MLFADGARSDADSAAVGRCAGPRAGRRPTAPPGTIGGGGGCSHRAAKPVFSPPAGIGSDRSWAVFAAAAAHLLAQSVVPVRFAAGSGMVALSRALRPAAPIGMSTPRYRLAQRIRRRRVTAVPGHSGREPGGSCAIRRSHPPNPRTTRTAHCVLQIPAGVGEGRRGRGGPRGAFQCERGCVDRLPVLPRPGPEFCSPPRQMDPSAKLADANTSGVAHTRGNN